LVLDPAVAGQIPLPPGAGARPFVVDADGRKVQARISAKSLRKAQGIIAEHGPGNVSVILQGSSKSAMSSPRPDWWRRSNSRR
jgi:hypothetical protein